MKRLYLTLLIISTTLVISCEKTKYENTGIITSADMAMCACCGGYFIVIDGNQYRFEKTELPDKFTFADNQLPLSVELNWEQKAETCTGFTWIKILKIRSI